MEVSKLSFKQRILVGFTLFGMFFGAGNLIFPIHLGQMAGSNVAVTILGFVVSAVGIPILAVAAIGNTHSSGLQELSGKVSRGYGYFFTLILYLTIGPFFAIPRCCTTSFTTGVAPLVSDLPEVWTLLIFSAVFFGLVLVFSLRPGKITVWIGKIINPIFLVFLFILIIVALLKPSIAISEVAPTEAYQEQAFVSSILEGYNTMDAIAGLAFGIVVINIIRGMGIQKDSQVASEVLHSGVYTAILMALIYILTIIMGTQSLGFTTLSENGGIAFSELASHYLGKAGTVILAITITFACLKTSIGLVTSCSETFSLMFPKIPYKVWAIGISIFSFGVSNVGLSAIIGYSVPVLMLIYPPAIVLIILALCGKLFNHDRLVYIFVMVFTWIASFFDFINTLPENVKNFIGGEKIVEFARKTLPLFDRGFGWLVPAAIGLAIGLSFYFVRRAKENA